MAGNDFETVIGLEVHAQLLTCSKIFCACSTKFGAEANSHTCPVCMGMPGVLPVLNRQVVELAIKAALAMDFQIAPKSIFARKNYFYPDLPKGYQISQFELPLASSGHLTIPLEGKKKKINICRMHLEEDAGKSMHRQELGSSLVDFNRCGVPLLEIVSEPELRSPQEASLYLQTMRSILRYLKVCDGNMEEGSLRCDANISLRPRGDEKLGVKVELKNMNSFKFVTRALQYETERQKAILFDGEEVAQETRLWDEAAGVTRSMRSKEEAHDYRYFPDPDLTPLVIDQKWINLLKGQLPELPSEKINRLMGQYHLSHYDAQLLTEERETADYFEEAVSAYNSPKALANWLLNDLSSQLKSQKREIADSPVAPKDLAGLVKLIEEGQISGKIGKTVLAIMYNSSASPQKIVEQENLQQITDTFLLEKIIKDILAKNQNQVEQYRQGKKKVLGYFVGQVMKQSQGKANPKLVNELILKQLEV